MTLRQKIVGCYALVAVVVLAACALVAARLYLPIYWSDLKAEQIKNGMTANQVREVIGQGPHVADYGPNATEVWEFSSSDYVVVCYFVEENDIVVANVVVRHHGLWDRLRRLFADTD